METGEGVALTNRPYGPPSNVVDVLQRLRDRNLPDRLDAEFLRDAGISVNLASRTMFGLQFLGLVNNFEPTDALRSIAVSTDEEYRTTLADLVQSAYSDVFDVLDPEKDSQDKFTNFFRRYTPASQRSRMVTFFLGICREAGLAVLEGPKPRRSSASTSQSRPRPRAPQRTAQAAQQQSEPPRRQGSQIPSAIQLLVESLPPEGGALSKERRKQWLSLADAALAFVYPERSEQADDQPASPAEDEA